MRPAAIELDVSNPLYIELFGTSSKRGQDRKLSIMNAVVNSLAVNGLHHTTFDSVGKLVKMERSHLVYYFKTHDGMIQAAVFFVNLTAQSITATRVEKAATPQQKLVAIVEAAFDHLGACPHHAPVLGLFYHLCTHDSSYRQLQVGFRRLGAERLLGVLKELGNKKKPSDEELLSIAKTIQAIIFGYLLEYISANPGWTLEKVKTLVLRAVCRLIEGELGAAYSE